MEWERAIDERARVDTKVVWPSTESWRHNPNRLLLVVLAVVTSVALVNVVVATGVLGLFG